MTSLHTSPTFGNPGFLLKRVSRNVLATIILHIQGLCPVAALVVWKFLEYKIKLPCHAVPEHVRILHKYQRERPVLFQDSVANRIR